MLQHLLVRLQPGAATACPVSQDPLCLSDFKSDPKKEACCSSAAAAHDRSSSDSSGSRGTECGTQCRR